MSWRRRFGRVLGGVLVVMGVSLAAPGALRGETAAAPALSFNFGDITVQDALGQVSAQSGTTIILNREVTRKVKPQTYSSKDLRGIVKQLLKGEDYMSRLETPLGKAPILYIWIIETKTQQASTQAMTRGGAPGAEGPVVHSVSRDAAEAPPAGTPPARASRRVVRPARAAAAGEAPEQDEPSEPSAAGQPEGGASPEETPRSPAERK